MFAICFSLKKIVNKCFDESTFFYQKSNLLFILSKDEGHCLYKERVANYCPVFNLTFLPRIKERAILY